MYKVRTTESLHEPKPFNFKLRLMRHTDHKNGTPSVGRIPMLVPHYKSIIKEFFSHINIYYTHQPLLSTIIPFIL